MDNQKIIQLNANGRYSYMADGLWGKRQTFSNLKKLITALTADTPTVLIVKFNRMSLGEDFVIKGTRRVIKIEKALGLSIVRMLPDSEDSFSYTCKLITRAL